MNAQDFRELLDSRRVLVSETYKGWSWSERKAVAKLTGQIDWHCGKCPYGTRRCCTVCATNIGNLDIVHPNMVKRMAHLFDELLGFWTPDGCSLPRGWRSYCCLTYRCAERDEPLEWQEESVLDALKTFEVGIVGHSIRLRRLKERRAFQSKWKGRNPSDQDIDAWLAESGYRSPRR